MGRHGRRTVFGERTSGRSRARPGYYNREGQANAKTRQGSFFYGSPTEYADILEASRAAAHRRDSRFDEATARRYLPVGCWRSRGAALHREW